MKNTSIVRRWVYRWCFSAAHVLLLSVTSLNVFGADIQAPEVVFQKPGEKILLAKYMRQWIPPEPVNIQALLANEYIEEFEPFVSSTFMGQDRETWLVFTIANQADTVSDLVLSLDNNQFSEVELIYQDAQGEVYWQVTGLNHSFESRPLDYNYFAFPIRVEPQSTQTIYLRVLTPFRVYFSPKLTDQKGFIQEVSNNAAYIHLFIGLLISAFAYLMVLSLYTNLERDIFYFGLFTLFAMLIILYVNGFLMRYFSLSGEPAIVLWLWIILGLQCSYLMVNKLYFHTAEKYPLINAYLNVCLVVIGILFILSFFLRLSVIVNLELIFVAHFLVVIILVSCFIWFKERGGVTFFVLGNLGMLAGSTLSTVAAQGLAADDWLAKHGYEVGFCWQVLFFNWAVTQKVRRSRAKENQLVTATLVAQAESKAKSDFIAKMSHEIRTPMNGVLGMVQLLRTTPVTDEQKHYLNVIDSSGKILLAVINDILDYSRLIAGKIELANESFDLEKMIAELNTLFWDVSHSKGLSFNTIIAPGVPLHLSGDSTRLRQILTNLLSNAFKFTDKGLVVLKVKERSRKNQFSVLEFTVADTGIGIAEEDQSSLFQEFTQVESNNIRRYGGSGLGLSICKQFVELMGGEINLVSFKGEGAEFVFAVPLERCELASEAEYVEPGQAALDRKGQKNILVAEDNDVNREVIDGFLQRLGYSADFAVNGKEALQRILDIDKDYDLVLMDCEMPILDGIEVTQKVRSWEKSENRKPLPIVALTAHASQQYLEKCLQNGMSDCLCKPVMFRDFEVLLYKYLQSGPDEGDKETVNKVV